MLGFSKPIIFEQICLQDVFVLSFSLYFIFEELQMNYTNKYKLWIKNIFHWSMFVHVHTKYQTV